MRTRHAVVTGTHLFFLYSFYKPVDYAIGSKLVDFIKSDVLFYNKIVVLVLIVFIIYETTGYSWRVLLLVVVVFGDTAALIMIMMKVRRIFPVIVILPFLYSFITDVI